MDGWVVDEWMDFSRKTFPFSRAGAEVSNLSRIFFTSHISDYTLRFRNKYFGDFRCIVNLPNRKFSSVNIFVVAYLIPWYSGNVQHTF